MSKSATFTRWDRRPLTDEQLSYARADVEHLLPLAASLRERLEQRGRLEWAREESRPLEEASDERDPDEVFRRLPRVADLKAQAAAVALELTRWRERIAEREDRHVRWILPDPAIVEVARRQPTKLGQLGDIRGVKGSSLRRLGPEILDAVRRGREAPPVKLDRTRAEIPPDEAGALVALAEALLRARAHEAELAYGLIAARAELLEVVTSVLAGREQPSVPVLAGWRRDLVGAELLELLAGRRTSPSGSAACCAPSPTASPSGAAAWRGRSRGTKRRHAYRSACAGRRGIGAEVPVAPLAGGEAQLVLIVCAQQLVRLDAELEAALDRRQLEDQPGPELPELLAVAALGAVEAVAAQDAEVPRDHAARRPRSTSRRSSPRSWKRRPRLR